MDALLLVITVSKWFQYIYVSINSIQWLCNIQLTLHRNVYIVNISINDGIMLNAFANLRITCSKLCLYIGGTMLIFALI